MYLLDVYEGAVHLSSVDDGQGGRVQGQGRTGRSNEAYGMVSDGTSSHHKIKAIYIIYTSHL